MTHVSMTFTSDSDSEYQDLQSKLDAGQVTVVNPRSPFISRSDDPTSKAITITYTMPVDAV